MKDSLNDSPDGPQKIRVIFLAVFLLVCSFVFVWSWRVQKIVIVVVLPSSLLRAFNMFESPMPVTNWTGFPF